MHYIYQEISIHIPQNQNFPMQQSSDVNLRALTPRVQAFLAFIYAPVIPLKVRFSNAYTVECTLQRLNHIIRASVI